MAGRFAGRRFSFWRLIVLVVAAAAVGYLAFAGFRQVRDTIAVAQGPGAWFAGYVDVTATPQYAMESTTAVSQSQTVLSFVVAHPTQGCVPSWGGAYTLTEAATELDLDRRIQRMVDQGRGVAISFGGQANQELALRCTTVPTLTSAYRSVVDRYPVSTIDLDIEGAALLDTAATERRAAAIAELQAERRADDEELAVWLTLPVSPQGLTPEGIAVVDGFLAAGVDLAGVNGMTMNYGGSKAEGTSMSSASIDALNATHAQLSAAWRRAGFDLADAEIWMRMGATPMLGQNDVAGEVFTLADAAALNDFGRSVGLGRMSVWSYNRDLACSANYADLTRVSDSCSGVAQNPGDFGVALLDGFGASLLGSEGNRTDPSDLVPYSEEDDPATSPYPIWNEDGSYPAGTKIVWHRNVYEAKWWTQGDLPDDPTAAAGDTPWRLIGPVLEGEEPVQELRLPDGYYKDWDPERVYESGDAVMLDGRAYRARWWNQGTSPESALADPGNSPWAQLDEQTIRRLLDELAESETAAATEAEG